MPGARLPDPMTPDATSFPDRDLDSFASAVRDAAPGAFEERVWSLHGVGVRLIADHPQTIRCMDNLLGVFPPAPPTGSDVRFLIATRRQWTLPAGAEILPPSRHEVIDPRAEYGAAPRFARRGRLNFYDVPPLGGAAYDLEAGLCVAGLADPAGYRPWLLEHLILQTLALELLRGRGLFWLHAGCVARGGRAVIFPGHSGSGKTTACLNLACRGFDFLAEDRVFVRPGDGGVRLLAYPRDMAVTRETLALLPALREKAGSGDFATRKLRVPASALFPGRAASTAAPGLIVFPKVVNAESSRLTPVPAALALRRLLPSSLLASHPEVSARHFQALSALAGASRAYDASLGRDLAAMPDLIRRTLDELPEGAA